MHLQKAVNEIVALPYLLVAKFIFINGSANLSALTVSKCGRGLDVKTTEAFKPPHLYTENEVKAFQPP